MVRLEVSYRAVSKAGRVYKFFKPKEIVQGEKFDLELRFQNLEEKFHGGSSRLVFWYPPNVYDPQMRIEIPSIDEKQSKTIEIRGLIMASSGSCGLVFQDQQYVTYDAKRDDSPYLWTSKKELLKDDSWLDFSVASKEEIYQKYSLVVALCAFVTSIVALTVALIDVIVHFIHP